MRALTTVSVSLCLFAFLSLSFAAPAHDAHDHIKSHKPMECEKGKRFYKDEHGKIAECHKYKDSKKDHHARGFDGHASDLSFSSVNVTNDEHGAEIESSGSYQEGESGSYQYNGTVNPGGNVFYPGGNLRNGLRLVCKTTTVRDGTAATTTTTTLSATPSDDDLLHLTAIVNALPTDALEEIL